MALNAGSRLGSYEIVAPLGAGGMGEVYRARDPRLGRDVAIKVLPAAFADDADRLTRFTREAQTLAALNHPNIAHIHGFEESGGTHALVMELVEGEDLSEVIARGPVPVPEARAIARQIIDALEAAHEQGIVHRDLKPANIKLRPDGTVKVLDFGLAKALDPAGSTSAVDMAQSPTLTARATMAGVLVGTAAYMSPEQARGKPVDRRADVWAFGVVLYEMLTGRRAFDGEDISTTLAGVIKDDVAWAHLPADVPAPMRRLLRHCLEKDPRRRLSGIGDARFDLDDAGGETVAPSSLAASAPPRRTPWALFAGVAALAAVVTLVVTRLVAPVGQASHAAGSIHAVLPLSDSDVLGYTNMAPLAISPNGSTIAYVVRRETGSQLVVRRLADAEPVPLARTDRAVAPFFSPDGQWIGFFAAERLRAVSVDGSQARDLCSAPNPRGGAWAPDGYIYFAATNTAGLMRIPATGGSPSVFTRLDKAHGETSHRWPAIAPDGKTLLFGILTGPGTDQRSIVAQSLGGGDRHVLVQGGDTPRVLEGGWLLYNRLDILYAARWRPGDAALGRELPVALTEHPRTENEAVAAYALSPNGTLVYLAGGAARYAQRLVTVDEHGTVTPLPAPIRDYQSVAVSPDAQRAVVQINGGTISLWLYDFTRHTLTPFVTDEGSAQAPVWSGDGSTIFYRATRLGLRTVYAKPVEGGAEQPLSRKPGVIQTPTAMTPDGRWLLFNEEGGDSESTWQLQPAGDHTPQHLPVSSGENFNSQVSPDGHWIAWIGNESGTQEVYVRRFPMQGVRTQVSNGGGREPKWSHDGRTLYFRNASQMLAVSFSGGVVGQPRVLFDGDFVRQTNGNTCYDLLPDGRIICAQGTAPSAAPSQIDLVVNVGDEVRRLAREAK